MGEYYGKKSLNMSRKTKRAKEKGKAKEKSRNTITSSQKKKKAIEAKMVKNNSSNILAKNFDFDPQEYRDKSLLFDLKKTSEEQILRRYWKKYLMTTNILLNIEMEQIPSK